MTQAIIVLAAVIGVAVAGSYHGRGYTNPGGYRYGSQSTWGEWGYWSTCSKNCGGGYQTRSRECIQSHGSYGNADCPGNATESRSCNNNYCVVNGGWSDWGYYGECSATCGAGTKTRYRTCTNPAPSYGGSDCYGSDHESVDCNNGYCSVNGGWSDWGYYGECSATCGAGTKSRYRTCTNPAPSYGGADCYGSDSQSVDCNKGYCPVHGGWGEWGYYGDCSVDCGTGVKTRHRYCNNPAPAHGGDQCYGSDVSTESCTGYHCQVNGGWSDWGYYGECSATCGAGTKSRYRTCTNPTPSYGGADCYGSDHESVDCNNGYCSVNGDWSDWGYYGECSATCGAGTKSRYRTCTNPAPSYGGADCYGSDHQSVDCNKGYCPENGGWTEWGYYGECSVTCGSGTKTRYRYCTNPTPAYGGSQCYGDDSQNVSCNKSYCPIDGDWTYWTSWSTCSVTCGTGSSYRSRSCTNPSPSYNGAQCTGSATESKSCQLSTTCNHGHY